MLLSSNRWSTHGTDRVFSIPSSLKRRGGQWNEIMKEPVGLKSAVAKSDGDEWTKAELEPTSNGFLVAAFYKFCSQCVGGEGGMRGQRNGVEEE